MIKSAFVGLCLLLAAGPALAGTISASEAAAHVGEIVTVEGVVTNVYTARSGRATFLDFGAPYPNNVFAGVIFADDAARVGPVNGLEGRTVDLTGRIQLYRGHPEIILKTRDRIKVH
jgi:exonuclease VII large subunit